VLATLASPAEAVSGSSLTARLHAALFRAAPLAPPTLAGVHGAILAAMFLDRRSGKRVAQCGGINSDGLMMVKGADSVPYYVNASNLVPCNSEGAPDYSGQVAAGAAAEDDPIPVAAVPVVETRLNLNVASAEDLARAVPGLGYRVAKAVKALQTTLPGERFTAMDQLRPVSPRTNWDEVIESNTFYLG